MHATDLRPTLAISIVSHGHGPLVQELLLALAQHSGAGIARVILTLNIPESVLTISLPSTILG